MARLEPSVKNYGYRAILEMEVELTIGSVAGCAVCSLFDHWRAVDSDGVFQSYTEK